MVGFRPVIEADKGYLLGGRMVEDGPIFEQFSEALTYFNAVTTLNVEAGRSVKNKAESNPFEAWRRMEGGS